MKKFNKSPEIEEQLLAIALKYTGESVPKVTATGAGHIAQEILSRAQEHGVPIHEDSQLAPLLARVPQGNNIPENLYAAVAEVLAFTFWLEEQKKNHSR